jgi:hypothetical protein
MNNLIEVLRKCITGLLEAEAKADKNVLITYWDDDADCADIHEVARTALNLHRPMLEYVLADLEAAGKFYAEMNVMPLDISEHRLLNIARIFADDPKVAAALEECDGQ